MTTKHVKPICTLIKNIVNYRIELENRRKQLVKLSKFFNEFSTKFPNFIIIEENYSNFDEYVNDFCHNPFYFDLHKDAIESDIELLNEIFKKNKIDRKYLYIDLLAGYHGKITTKYSEQIMDHVYIHMYENLMKCLNIFYKKKTKGIK